jgi:hypothetical protein
MSDESELAAIEKEARALQQLDAPLSFEPIERTMARMIQQARFELEGARLLLKRAEDRLG